MEDFIFPGAVKNEGITVPFEIMFITRIKADMSEKVRVTGAL